MNGSEAILVDMAATCIYAHYVGEELIYIGSGTMERAFTVRNRSPEWKNLTSNGYSVVIIQRYNSKDQAEEEEKRLIKELNPRCNLIYNGWVNPKAIGNSWNVGRKHSAVSKAIMSARQKASWIDTKRKTGRRRPRQPIKCLDTGAIYDGLRAAAKYTNVHFTCISQCVNGHRKTAGGLRFVRLED